MAAKLPDDGVLKLPYRFFLAPKHTGAELALIQRPIKIKDYLSPIRGVLHSYAQPSLILVQWEGQNDNDASVSIQTN